MLTLNHQKLIRFIDTTLRKQRYGTMSLTVVLKNGVPVVESAQLVKQKRRKYKVPTASIDTTPRKA